MNSKTIQVLKMLKNNSNITQRNLSKIVGVSLGTINNIIKELEDDTYIVKQHVNKKFYYEVTEKGIKEIENNSIKLAVILAAGLGSRLHPVTKDKMPKGFLEIEGKSLIERSIEKLLKNDIKKIIIVTGHLHNYYDELAKKYKSITTIINPNYKNTGSMSSLAVAKDLINEDFLLLESDLIYDEKAIEILQFTDKKDCVLLSGKTNSGDEVYIEVRNNNIYKVSKDKHGLNNIYGELVGITKISVDLYSEMLKQYNKNTNPQYHYEYAIEDSSKNYIVEYEKINDLIWAEIDDESHLERVLTKIVPKLKEKNQI